MRSFITALAVSHTINGEFLPVIPWSEATLMAEAAHIKVRDINWGDYHTLMELPFRDGLIIHFAVSDMFKPVPGKEPFYPHVCRILAQQLGGT